MSSKSSGISEVYGNKALRKGIKIRDLLNQELLRTKLSELLPFLYNEYRTVLEKRQIQNEISIDEKKCLMQDFLEKKLVLIFVKTV